MSHRVFFCFAVVCMLLAALPCPANDPAEREALPNRIDLRCEFKRLELTQRSQGARGTCSVFATVGAVEFACAKQDNRGVVLSVEFANWAANESTGRGDDGDFFHNIIKGVQKHGVCLESTMPYENQFAADRKPSADAMQQATEFSQQHKLAFHWIKDWKRKPGLDDADVLQVKQVLAAGYPVSAGSYHSVLFVGYEDNADLPGGGRFLISDSNRQETEINYQAAKERFCDMFWVESLQP